MIGRDECVGVATSSVVCSFVFALTAGSLVAAERLITSRDAAGGL